MMPDKETEEVMFDLVQKNYCDANKEYLQKQIKIASEYLTEEQKNELRKRGIEI